MARHSHICTRAFPTDFSNLNTMPIIDSKKSTCTSFGIGLSKSLIKPLCSSLKLDSPYREIDRMMFCSAWVQLCPFSMSLLGSSCLRTSSTFVYDYFPYHIRCTLLAPYSFITLWMEVSWSSLLKSSIVRWSVRVLYFPLALIFTGEECTTKRK
jgi:Na+/H+ antiporter NhaC